MTEIDVKRAEQVYLEMQQERDERYPDVTDQELLRAVYEGACAYERKKLQGFDLNKI